MERKREKKREIERNREKQREKEKKGELSFSRFFSREKNVQGQLLSICIHSQKGKPNIFAKMLEISKNCCIYSRPPPL